MCHSSASRNNLPFPIRFRGGTPARGDLSLETLEALQKHMLRVQNSWAQRREVIGDNHRQDLGCRAGRPTQ